MRPFLSIIIFIGVAVRAADNEGVAKVVAGAYAQEQVKYQLAEYLNRNPEIVFSKNPQVGTQAMQFIGKMLAGYNFVVAESDRERMFAAAQFLAPDPYTMMAIFAVQLADTVVTMRHQKDLAKMYEEVAQIQKETVRILAPIYAVEFNHQITLLRKLNDSLERLKKLEKEASEATDPAMQIQTVFAIDKFIDRLDGDFTLVNQEVDFEKLGFPSTTREKLREVVAGYKKSKTKITETKSALLSVFKATMATQWLAAIDRNIENKRETMRLYGVCVKAINEYSSQVFRKVEVTVDTGFLNDCQKHFGLNWES